MLIIPEVLIAGVCFPEIEIENQVPHITLMVNQGLPKDSDAVLGQCFLNQGCFSREYATLKRGKSIKKEF